MPPATLDFILLAGALASSTVAQLAKLDCNRQVGEERYGLAVTSPAETRRLAEGAMMTY